MERTLSQDQIQRFCQELIPHFKEKQIVLLEGPLGAGKTELVKTFVSLLGGKESSSPTYSLINEYPLKKGKAFHVDLYRIKDAEDLESVGFWDLFENTNCLIFIEWGSRMDQSLLPLDWPKIAITIEKPKDISLRKYLVSCT